MELFNGSKQHTNASRAIFKLELSIDEAEMILIALGTLERLEQNPDLAVKAAIQETRKFFTVDHTPKFDSDMVSIFLDRLYAPVWDYQFDNDLLKDDNYNEDEFITALESNQQVSENIEPARFKHDY